MDATKMTYADDSFDMVLDKGTLDALIVSPSSHGKCDKSLETSQNLIKEMARVLKKKTGKWLIITHGNPIARMFMFNKALDVDEFKILYSKESSLFCGSLQSAFGLRPADQYNAIEAQEAAHQHDL